MRASGAWPLATETRTAPQAAPALSYDEEIERLLADYLASVERSNAFDAEMGR